MTPRVRLNPTHWAGVDHKPMALRCEHEAWCKQDDYGENMQAGDETGGGIVQRCQSLRGKLWDLAKKDLDWLIA
jgi:hypothetical protein